MRAFVTAIILLAINLTTFGQEWVQTYNQAQAKYGEEAFDEAYELAKSSLALYQSQDGTLSNNYEKILRLLANLSYWTGDIENGLSHINKEIDVKEKTNNLDNLDHAEALYTRALLLQEADQHELARADFEAALPIYTAFYSASDPVVIEVRWKLAHMDYLEGHEAEALATYQQTIPVYDISEGLTNDYIQAVFDYSNLLLINNHNEAAPYLDMLEDVYAQFGDAANYDMALVKINKGLLQHKEGAYEQAEAHYNEAYTLLTDMGESQSKPFYDLANLRAVNYQKLGDTASAEKQLALVNESGVAGSQSITSLLNSANLKIQQRQYDEAISLLTQSFAEDADETTTANISLALIQAYLLSNKIEEALKISNDLNSRIEALEDPSLRANYYWLSGELLSKTGDYKTALTNLNKATALIAPGSVLYSNLLVSKGQLFLKTGDYVDAEETYLQHLTELASQDLDQTLSYAITLSNLGIAQQNQAKYLEAQSSLSKAAILAESNAGASSEILAGINENLSVTLSQLGRYKEAEQLINHSLAIRKEKSGTSSLAYASSLQNLGRMKLIMGKYHEAEPLYIQALEIKKEKLGNGHPDYAHALNNTALLYQTMGNYDQALPLFRESLQIIEKSLGTEHPEYATALENIATLYVAEGKLTEALSYLEKALEIDFAIYGDSHPTYATTLHNLASVHKDLGNPAKALELFEKALQIERDVFGTEHRTFASTLYNLAVLKQQQSKFDEAEAHFKEALDIRKRILGNNHPEYTYSLYGLAGLYHATQRLTEASPYYDEVISNYLVQIKEFFPSLSENEKGAFYAKIRPVIESYQDYCIEFAQSDLPGRQKAINDLYNLQLKTKALLLQSSNKVKNSILNSGNAELVAEYSSWLEMKDQLSKFLSYSKEDLAEQQIDLDQMNQQINALEKSISKQSAGFDELNDDTIDWTQIKEALNPEQVAIEIIRIDRRFAQDEVLYAILLLTSTSKEGPQLSIIKEGKRLEDKIYNYYRNAIKFTVGDTISYNHFWKPIDKQLQGAKQVFVSADGIYNKINPNTLYNAEESDYVIDEYIVRNVSNTREIIADETREVMAAKHADLFGFPDYDMIKDQITTASQGQLRAMEFGFSSGTIPSLPGTRTEVTQLINMLDTTAWQAEAYLADKANETQMKSISQTRLLHIATHGFFKSDVVFDDDDGETTYSHIEMNPLFRSGLLLAGSGTAKISNDLDSEDGVLTAYEAMNLDLEGTELVVLSACETGSGEVRNGEGVYGLQRAFQVAGANAIIMSLWQVDDNTTQKLMVNFYTQWLGGQDKFEAFKQAQLNLKEEYPDPFHWGAFIIIGTD